MGKQKLSFIFDTLLIVFLTFIVIYAISSFYLSAVSSTVISLSVSLAVLFFYDRRSRTKIDEIKTKKENDKNYEDILYTLRINSDNKNYEIIKSVLKNENKSPYFSNGKLCTADGYSVFCKFGYEPTTADELLQYLKNLNSNEKVIIFSYAFSKTALNLRSEFNDKILLIDYDKLFPFLKKTNFEFLEKPFVKKPLKEKLFSLFSQSFSKKNLIKTTLYGVLLMVISRFVFFPTFYVITGSILLIYSVCILFFSKSPKKSNGKLY